MLIHKELGNSGPSINASMTYQIGEARLQESIQPADVSGLGYRHKISWLRWIPKGSLRRSISCGSASTTTFAKVATDKSGLSVTSLPQKHNASGRHGSWRFSI